MVREKRKGKVGLSEEMKARKRANGVKKKKENETRGYNSDKRSVGWRSKEEVGNEGAGDGEEGEGE